jgi:hypothetical protein
MKDCAFRYATGNGTIEDVDLISFADAKELFDKYMPVFMDDLENGKDPEMAIWINMSSPDLIITTKHLNTFCLLKDGRMYVAYS